MPELMINFTSSQISAASTYFKALIINQEWDMTLGIIVFTNDLKKFHESTNKLKKIGCHLI